VTGAIPQLGGLVMIRHPPVVAAAE
jgi:hypothetical protein